MSNPAYAHLTGGKVKLSGVTGNAQITERARVSYPIRTESGRAVRVKTRGPGLYLSSSSDNILSMALLLKAGHDVRLKAGSPQDPEDGGIIYLADGDTMPSLCGRCLAPSPCSRRCVGRGVDASVWQSGPCRQQASVSSPARTYIHGASSSLPQCLGASK
eukprot:3797175-Rhodomonas_salina.1